MKRIKIRIEDRAERTRGIYEVMKRGEVICLRDHVFIVPEPAIELLDSLGVKYENFGVEPWDRVVRALRSPSATSAQ